MKKNALLRAVAGYGLQWMRTLTERTPSGSNPNIAKIPREPDWPLSKSMNLKSGGQYVPIPLQVMIPSGSSDAQAHPPVDGAA
jgi:hypothetical protein